ncbi:MAG: metallophosphoesterase [Eubacterium sp.]|nr:metallophosphoesterase [Eubacterium sp.]
MKILVLADIESKYLWDFFEKSKLEGIDLILSAGDLSAAYLEFLATYAKCPVLYIHGNHDTKYENNPPLGCICVDDDIYVYNGIKIMGLGGSMCYNYGSFQYTEKEMRSRYMKLKPKIWRRKGIDILLTHAPAYGVNDGEDLPHRGFEVFRTILDKYEPKLFVHGHVHMNYGRNHKREDMYGNTRVINAFEKYIIEL